METVVYNQNGKESGKINLPEAIFALPWNADLVHQVFVSMRANLRNTVAHVKDRGEVRGGGKKPWRQKGTGRARHGSSRSPIWVGGGITHGPDKEKVFARKINKTMKAKALFVALSQKLKDNELLFIDHLAVKEPKTKEAKVILEKLASIKGFESLAKKNQNALYLANDKKDANVDRAFANFNNLTVGEIRNLNLLDVMNAKYLLIVNPKESLVALEAKMK